MYLCDYPFIFDGRAKSKLLQTDQMMQMRRAMMTNDSDSDFDTEPCFWLYVDRKNIVQTALNEIDNSNLNDLKRPLRVCENYNFFEF